VLIIAGESRNREYFEKLKNTIFDYGFGENFIAHLQFIPEKDIEKYFMATDCLVLPYRTIFQSGLHVLAYAYGIPVIATDVGSFKGEDIIVNETGLICKQMDADDLKDKILEFFNSDLYHKLENNREGIKKWAKRRYSWDEIAVNTFEVYKNIENFFL
jgi:glycosyltransferase involved in cell wall biosynthesis